MLTSYSGNNTISRYEGNADGTAYQTSSNLSFTYTQDPMQQPAVLNNMQAAIVNAFYLVNTVHDISYMYVNIFSLFIFSIMLTFSFRYGFTNFQSNNFGKGGKENDRITISVQAKVGIDFASPPDGQSEHISAYSPISPAGADSNDVL